MPPQAGGLCVAPVLYLKCHCGILSLSSDDIIHTELRGGGVRWGGVGGKASNAPSLFESVYFESALPRLRPSWPPDDSYEKYLAAHLTLSPSLTLQSRLHIRDTVHRQISAVLRAASSLISPGFSS